MRRAAYSLLELTVVLAIAGLLLALVAPRFAAVRDGASVRAAMTDLTGAFSTARQTAIMRRMLVAVVLDTASGTVELRASGVRLLRHSLRDVYGIVLAANRDSTVYDPRGLGYGVSNLSVTVRRGAFVDTLTMSRLGRVRW
ncbi:MAG TPA: GspH/FimT family pseudopilin [Gemmatimonadaceae bacterium]|nr:GspH/FimT family pseudopilin [Gemmatimonadaceae bacterium]